jgi:hypothetical protein
VVAQDSKVKMSLTSVTVAEEGQGQRGQVLSAPRLLVAGVVIPLTRVLHQVLT